MATYSSPSYVDSDTFTVEGDYTSGEGGFDIGRALKMDCGADGVKYGIVESASYSDPNTTVNLDPASDAITSNLAEVVTSPIRPGHEGNISRKYQQLTVLTKTGDYSLTVNDLGKTIRMNSSSTATFTLPSVGASEDGSRVTLSNAGINIVKVSASDNDTIWNKYPKIDIGQSIVLEYCHSETSWFPIYIWDAITPRADDKGYIVKGDFANILIFVTDVTFDSDSARLREFRYGMGAVSDASTKGYFAGGYSGGYFATADKVTFSSDITMLCTSADLSQARRYLAGLSERSTHGYFAGGRTSGGSVSTADKVTFSTDATAACTTADLSQAREQLAGISEGSTQGYFAGGDTGSVVATADKITFSNDTTAACTTANLSTARSGLAGLSEGSTKGYFAGGYTGSPVATADKITFADDTTAACTTADLSQARWLLAGLSEGSTKGYFAGGYTGDTTGYPYSVDTTDQITFSTDATAACTTADLTAERSDLAGLSTAGL